MKWLLDIWAGLCGLLRATAESRAGSTQAVDRISRESYVRSIVVGSAAGILSSLFVHWASYVEITPQYETELLARITREVAKATHAQNSEFWKEKPYQAALGKIIQTVQSTYSAEMFDSNLKVVEACNTRYCAAFVDDYEGNLSRTDCLRCCLTGNFSFGASSGQCHLYLRVREREK